MELYIWSAIIMLVHMLLVADCMWYRMSFDLMKSNFDHDLISSYIFHGRGSQF